MTGPITLLLADDHPIFRKGLADVLRAEAGFTVVAEAGDGAAALALVRQHHPRIAVLDVEMPQASGLAVAETIQRERLTTEVVMLTSYTDAGMFRRALDLGARGYVLKDTAVSEIVACLHMVAAGRAWISPALSSELVRHHGDMPVAELDALAELTAAERRVLTLVARGLTSGEIAGTLGNSPKTVENLRSHICRKLGLHGPQALLRFALERRTLLE